MLPTRTNPTRSPVAPELPEPELDPDELDPAVSQRPWTPHVTVAYAVPDAARVRARELVAARLPLVGAWDRAQSWDLDVRPTELVHDVPCVPAPPRG
jgi:hypothetical protein